MISDWNRAKPDTFVMVTRPWMADNRVADPE